MTDQSVAVPSAASVMAEVIAKGDLAGLTDQQRVDYYWATCTSLNLNPLTQPFQFIRLRAGGPLVLYATKGATDQIRANRHIDIRVVARERVDDVYVVTVEATTPDGRTDSDIGAVPIKGLNGADLANALMKCTTKAKRRVTLSIAGLGMIDESELDMVPMARPVDVDVQSGRMREAPPPALPSTSAASTWGDERQRYTVMAVSRGFSDAAIDLLWSALKPKTIGDCANLIDAIDAEIERDIDPDTGEIVPIQAVQIANLIATAPDKRTMAALAATTKEAGITAGWLRSMWMTKNKEVPVEVAVDQPELVSAGSPGNDQFTQ